MSFNIGTILSSQFRVDSIAEFENDPLLKLARTCFEQPLEVHKFENDRICIAMHGRYPTLQPSGFADEYYCKETNQWFEYDEPKDIEVNICEIIKNHIVPDDKCMIISTSADNNGSNIGFEKADITSEKIDYISSAVHSSDKLTKNGRKPYDVKVTTCGISFILDIEQQPINFFITNELLKKISHCKSTDTLQIFFQSSILIYMTFIRQYYLSEEVNAPIMLTVENSIDDDE